MSDKSRTAKHDLNLTYIVIPILILISFFTYGESLLLTALFVFLLLLYYIALRLAFIPYIGVFVQGAVMAFVLNPIIFAYTPLYSTWVVSLAFWLFLILGAFLTLFVSLLKPILAAIQRTVGQDG